MTETAMHVAAGPDRYTSQFERLVAERAAVDPVWLKTIRRAAFDRFQALGFPTSRDEEWRFTPIRPLVETAFEAPRAPVGVGRRDLAPFVIAHAAGSVLVFVNGRFAPALSTLRSMPAGVVAGSLRVLIESDPGLVDPYLTRCAPFAQQPFTALNTALVEDGAVVYIPAAVVLPEPLQILYFSSSAVPALAHPRTLVVAGDNSRGKVIETYAGPDDQRYFTNAVTEIVCGEHAQLEHYRVQREGVSSFHVSSTHVYLERAAVFAQQNFTFGGALVRNDTQATLDAEGIECTLNGLYLANGDRLVDNHTTIDHAKPHCASHEVYKGMLDDRARGVFNGKIFVRQDAQKTDAKQTNQVLLLSDDATINTKPQLEIFADDVKCTHGATVGRLDAEALFYLRARGLGEDAARSMLIHAFASDIIDRVTIEPLRESLEGVLLGLLPR
jgi:Fe-S cluster assembly protein SufD